MHKEERQQHGEETGAVHREATSNADDADQHAANRWSNHARTIEHCRVHRNGPTHLIFGHHLAKERLPNGHVDGVNDTKQSSHEDEEWQRHEPRSNQHCLKQCEDHQADLCPHQCAVLWKCVSEYTAKEAKDHHWGELRRGNDAEPCRFMGELRDVPGLRNGLHPGARQRDELPKPEEAVVAMTKRPTPGWVDARPGSCIWHR